MTGPVISPDGKFSWDGSSWVPIDNRKESQTIEIRDSAIAGDVNLTQNISTTPSISCQNCGAVGNIQLIPCDNANTKVACQNKICNLCKSSSYNNYCDSCKISIEEEFKENRQKEKYLLAEREKIHAQKHQIEFQKWSIKKDLEIENEREKRFLEIDKYEKSVDFRIFLIKIIFSMFLFIILLLFIF